MLLLYPCGTQVCHGVKARSIHLVMLLLYILKFPQIIAEVCWVTCRRYA